MNPNTSVKFSYPIIPSGVIPSIGIGPTQGQRDTLTRVGFDPTVIYSEGRGFSFVTLIEMIGVHLIAVIAVAPTGKASFVYSYLQTRLRRHYNGKWPFSLVYVLKSLITAIRAITSNPKQACKSTEPELRNAFCSMYKPSFSLLAFVFVLSPQHWSWTLQAWNVHFLKVLHTSNRDKVRVCLEKKAGVEYKRFYIGDCYTIGDSRRQLEARKKVSLLWLSCPTFGGWNCPKKKKWSRRNPLKLKRRWKKKATATKNMMQIAQDLIYSWKQSYFSHSDMKCTEGEYLIDVFVHE